MLELNNLIKQYDGIKAVDNIELKIEKGDIFGFLGPNGAGKTTTIRMIMGIIEPDSGTILFNQKNISENGRGKLGYLPEDRGLYQKQKLEETINYFASLRGLSKKKQLIKHIIGWNVLIFISKEIEKLRSYQKVINKKYNLYYL